MLRVTRAATMGRKVTVEAVEAAAAVASAVADATMMMMAGSTITSSAAATTQANRLSRLCTAK